MKPTKTLAARAQCSAERSPERWPFSFSCSLPPPPPHPPPFSRCRHTHMACSDLYHRDTKAVFGKMFNHDDGVGKGDLDAAFTETKRLFEETFPEAGAYNPAPTMVRGPWWREGGRRAREEEGRKRRGGERGRREEGVERGSGLLR
jgi:hypothetical protein